jgi:NADH-quinone oxidoreductase subunit J
MITDFVLVMATVLAALATVITARLLWSAVGLALTSAILAALMFRLNSPIAAVFELSVCAGLIPVIFISAIGLTSRLSREAVAKRWRHKLLKYGMLPVIVLLAGWAMWHWHVPLTFAPPLPAVEQDVRNVLWNQRHIDLLGQMSILAAGAFGVVILIKGAKRE